MDIKFKKKIFKKDKDKDIKFYIKDYYVWTIPGIIQIFLWKT